MIVGREMLIYFEGLAKRQTRIFVDACDYGILTSDFDLDEARKNLQRMMRWFEYKLDKYNELGMGYHGSKTTMFIPYEQADNGFRGVNLSVEYHNMKKQKKEYLSIDITSAFSHRPGLK